MHTATTAPGRPIRDRLAHAWTDLRHAAHDVRVALHLAAHRIPFADRLGVIAVTLLLFIVIGHALTTDRVVDVCVPLLCERVGRWIELL